jgi:hypothetical protein
MLVCLCVGLASSTKPARMAALGRRREILKFSGPSPDISIMKRRPIQPRPRSLQSSFSRKQRATLQAEQSSRCPDTDAETSLAVLPILGILGNGK